MRCSIITGDDDLVFADAGRLLDDATDPDDVLDAALDVLEVIHRTLGLQAAATWTPIGRARLAGAPAHEVALLERLVRVEQIRDLPAAAALAREALELARTSGDAVVMERARVLAVSTALMAGEPVDLAELPQLTFEPGGPGVDASLILAELLVWANEHERAAELLRPMEAAARSSGSGIQLVRVLSQTGDLHLRAGDWNAASLALSEAMEVGDLIGFDVGPRSDLAWLSAARGDHRLARDLIDVVARKLPSAPALHRVHICARRGFVHSTAGEWHDAVSSLTAAREEALTTGFLAATALPFGHDLVEALVQVGALDRARAEADALAATADRANRPFDRALATRSRAVVSSSSGDLTGAVGLALLAIELHGDRPSVPFEEARTRLVAGAIMRRAGRRRDARVQVESALAVFEELGALTFTRRAHAELDRLRTRQAPAGLTSTEQRVADLAAAGRTNIEIASELAISVRTVESNLTRVYRKLSVRSRTELAARLPLPG